MVTDAVPSHRGSRDELEDASFPTTPGQSLATLSTTGPTAHSPRSTHGFRVEDPRSRPRRPGLKKTFGRAGAETPTPSVVRTGNRCRAILKRGMDSGDAMHSRPVRHDVTDVSGGGETAGPIRGKLCPPRPRRTPSGIVEQVGRIALRGTCAALADPPPDAEREVMSSLPDQTIEHAEVASFAWRDGFVRVSEGGGMLDRGLGEIQSWESSTCRAAADPRIRIR